MIARVIPLTRTRAIRGLFDYRLADALPGEVEQGAVAVGSLLKVPFAGRQVIAVVAELADHSELAPERLALVDAVLPARLPSDLVALAQWIASEYCSTPARSLSVLLPAGAGRGLTEKRVLVAELTEVGAAALDGAGVPQGSTVRLTAGQRAALVALRERGESPASEVGAPLLRRLEARGLVSLRRAVVGRRPSRHTVSRALSQAPELTLEQAAAVQSIFAALASLNARAAGIDRSGGSPAAPRDHEVTPMLLHGVTGSGKTEVYLRAAQATLEAGRGVIILVPEIALTPQALARFEARFGDVVAVLHSGMSEGARHDEWLRLARGEARVCVGPRSAVFAPLPDIGLIVVDEEHESSYKHEGDPRYDARTVAERRAAEHGALLLVGSATPRPESALRFERLRLAERVDGRPLPEVTILDMRGLHHPLHPDTRLALADCRHERGKAIMLLNRRGWSNFLSCGSCGRVWMCPNCDVALVLHRSGGTVACHHCGHSERVPRNCPDCGSVSVARHGAGTERLEHELLTTIAGPDFPVLRLDADVSGLDERARILERFHEADAGVLVGTQMVAKGHDFDDVGLGVVIDADQTLRFPDFRAEERTFALVTQLAGRAGRGGRGRVLVQTRAPNARPIRLAAEHDSETFLRGELRRRKALAYPPFTTLIRVVCSSIEAEGAHAVASALRTRIVEPLAGAGADEGAGAGSLGVLGPAPLFMLRGRSRSQLVIRATDRAVAVAAVGAAVDGVAGTKLARAVSISVDVDPQ